MATTGTSIVYIIDDDARVRAAIQGLLKVASGDLLINTPRQIPFADVGGPLYEEIIAAPSSIRLIQKQHGFSRKAEICRSH